MPSKFYGIAAAGRPVIFVGDPDGDIGKIVRMGDCGAVVRPQASEELANLLRDLRNNHDLRRKWGRNARRLVEERFPGKKAMSLCATFYCLCASSGGVGD